MFHKLVFRKRPKKKVYLKTYLSNTPNTVDQIQIQIHGLKFDQIQIQIRRICICICICKYKYIFDPSPVIEALWFHILILVNTGLVALQHHASCWTLLSTEHLAIKIWIKLYYPVISIRENIFEMLPVKCQPFCLGLNQGWWERWTDTENDNWQQQSLDQGDTASTKDVKNTYPTSLNASN